MEAKRTLSEILIEADNTKSVHVIDKLWKEIQLNRRDFTVSELKFAEEHLTILTSSMAETDMENLKMLNPYIRHFDQKLIVPTFNTAQMAKDMQISREDLIKAIDNYVTKEREYKWRYVWNLFKSLMKEINGLTFKKIF